MRLFLGALLSAVTLLALAPATPAAADPACTRLEGQASLAGSRWAGTTRWDDGDGDSWTLLLRADCVMVYSYSGQTYTNGRWYQRGEMLVLDTNDSFAVYMGHVAGNRASGVMYNQHGFKGTWSFRRTD